MPKSTAKNITKHFKNNKYVNISFTNLEGPMQLLNITDKENIVPEMNIPFNLKKEGEEYTIREVQTFIDLMLSTKVVYFLQENNLAFPKSTTPFVREENNKIILTFIVNILNGHKTIINEKTSTFTYGKDSATIMLDFEYGEYNSFKELTNAIVDFLENPILDISLDLNNIKHL